MQAVINFFQTLIDEHFYIVIISVILFSVLVVGLIVLSQIKKAQKEDKMYKEHAENAVKSLTPEEIDKISKNVADKETFYELLSTKTSTETESEEVKTEKPKKVKESKKEKVKETEPKEEEIEEVEEVIENTQTTETKKPSQHKKTAGKKPSQKPTQEAKTTRAYTGKWKIKQEDGRFFAELTASNGGLLLKTESYATMSNVKNGIETIKKNIESGNIAMSLDKYGHYHFKIFNNANRLVCISEDYSSKAKCESGIESVKRFSKSATMIIEENND